MEAAFPKLALLDVTFGTPAQNLACDEALLDELEAGFGEPTLRFWESHVHFVVLGYSNKIDSEVNRAECERRGIPILRRSSGGGTVLQGPRCLNYNLTLPITDETSSITATNRFVMERHREAVSTLVGREVQQQGCTDLTIGSLKFSGNAQRRKSRALVFHGSFLLNFDLPLIDAVLRHPSKEPDYRGHRGHRDFLTNLNVRSEAVKAALIKAWAATEVVRHPSHVRIEGLVKERYENPEWNEKF
jgi:lipoate-protein ligase A